MYNLAFDTTGQSCSVILTQDGITLEKSVKKMDFGQAEVLLPTIRNILDNHNITMNELDLITVCTGPGSFTGVRSSLSAARTFGLALPETGLTGVYSYEAYDEDICDVTVKILDPEEINEYAYQKIRIDFSEKKPEAEVIKEYNEYPKVSE